MTAHELLLKMYEAGFIVRVNGGSLQVMQARWIDDELAELIRTHKSELIRIIESESSHGE